MPRKPKKSPVRRTPAVRKTPAKKAAVGTKAVKPAAAKKVAAPAVVASTVEVVTPAFPADLVAQLRHPAVETAVDAAAALARTGDVRVVPNLVATLENADGYCHVVVRAAAAMALGSFDTTESVNALLVAARDGMAEVSSEAILALGQLKSAAAVDMLVEIVTNANGFYLNTTRHAAVRALGRIGAGRDVLNTVANSPWEDAAVVAAAREAIA
ncbi:MAG: HEAT repeat domain-containing protein [Tepidisphaeraceae bacterium]